MDNLLLSDVLSEYSRIRARNEAEQEARRKQVYAAVPQLKEIDEQKNALQLERIAQALDGNPIDTGDILALREKANMLLSNYPPAKCAWCLANVLLL